MSIESGSLPLIIAGPILRHTTADTFTVWFVSTQKVNAHVHLFDNNSKPKSYPQNALEQVTIRAGEACFMHTLIVSSENLFNDQERYFYDIELHDVEPHKDQQNNRSFVSQLLPNTLYPKQNKYSFVFCKNLKKVIHGSCRKAHFQGQDALPQLDKLIAQSMESESEWVSENNDTKTQHTRPDLLLFTGDQVYVDDVAGPMLCAIHTVIDKLGLYHESFEGSTISSSQELRAHANGYYKRDKLLPQTQANEDLSQSFFKGKRKPIFTSVNAKNHLIALNEMLALYLLSWSAQLWPLVSFKQQPIDDEFLDTYAREKIAIDQFVKGLPSVHRALAHVPSYMIFDDHDVTDDWNLTRAWEDDVYNNPFSKRIVGNAIVAYLLCQGMGNPEITWRCLLDTLHDSFTEQGIQEHDNLIDTLLAHNHWQYRLNTSPPIQVLDTRTQRWRSESNAKKPSGLMDWEGLCDLQQEIIGQDSVIMVSAAPVYGVKFIEAIQRVFITFGGALMVDAENWMAHRGTASVMLNIFRHIKTPPHFIILSGDVHYSFVYDISLRFRRNSPKITQFTCSGIHNQFPDKLITWFERLNRWLYGHRSPLNFLTKRRNMSIKERENSLNGLDVVNATSLGLLELNEKGHEHACKLILSNGDIVTFHKP